MIKEIGRCVREYKKASILTPLFMLIEVAIECVIPLIMAQLINNMYGGTLGPVFMYGIVLLGMAFVSLVFGALSGLFSAKASTGLAKNLRHDLFAKVQSFSFANIDKFSTSGLITRLTTDVTNVQNAFMMLIRLAVRCPLMLIFSLVMTITISAKISIVFAVAAPILAVGLFLIIFKVYPIYEKAFKKYDELNNSVQENIKGMRVVKSYVREEHEKKKFKKATDGLQKHFIKAERILMLTNPLMTFVMYAAVLAISAFGSVMIVSSFGGFEGGLPVWGELSTGDLSSLITYTTQILSSLMMLAMVLVMITMAAESAKRITEVLKEESSLKNSENPVMEVNGGEIDFENVCFKYSAKAEKDALSGINLKIKEGETVGILGGTGSGKSSLVQLIPRLYDVSEGSVKVGGVDVKKYDMDTLRHSVAVVLQKNVLFSGTIKENIRWGDKNATDEQIEEACVLAQADPFIKEFADGYDHHIEQGGANVSGGQKQRLCIARALVKKPKVLILDDSTSAVDTKTDAALRQAFKKSLPNTTKIIIAQRVASVMDADKIVVMDNGKIDDIGTHDELIERNEIYQEIYALQNKKGGDENE